MQYKIIDGQLFKIVDTTDINTKLNYVVEAARPYVEGIDNCEQQIEACEQQIAAYKKQAEDYKSQVQQIIAQSGLDAEAVKVINPDKANFLKI